MGKQLGQMVLPSKEIGRKGTTTVKALLSTQERANIPESSRSQFGRVKASTCGLTELVMKANTNKESKMDKAVSSDQTELRWEESSSQINEMESVTI